MKAGLAATSSEIVVFLDADVLNTTTEFVPRLVQPLLERRDIELVKGYYERPLHNMPTGGGRVNELAARPILALLYPGLGEIRQPLAGETASRRSALESITLESAYGVEIALLIDIARQYGVHSLAQVDLGVRTPPEPTARRVASHGGRRLTCGTRKVQGGPTAAGLISV